MFKSIQSFILPTVFILLSAELVSGQAKTAQLLPSSAKFIHSLKDKRGGFLGDVYIEDYKGDVFKKLLIVKPRNGRLDTLYSINNCVFRNPKGVDITFSKQNFNGYRIDRIKDDLIEVFGIGSATSGASDPADIVWNYDKRIFEVFQTP